MSLDYENIYLGGINDRKDKGKFKMSAAGLGYKSLSTGEIIAISGGDIDEVKFLRVARENQLRIKSKGRLYKFDGFLARDYDEINQFMRKNFNVTLKIEEVSTRGYNWGTVQFEHKNLIFSHDKEIFEIPLNLVSATNVNGKNEVSIEFAPDLKNSKVDSLVECRFYVPGTVTKGQITEEGILRNKDQMYADEDSGEMGEISMQSQQVALDENGEALSAAQIFKDTIKQKSNMDDVVSELVCSFKELLSLVPRGRFQIDFHVDALSLRGKSHDYKIMYTTIQRMFLLPKPDDLHWNFIVQLNPPIRQGNTRYPFVVFQIDREDEIELELTNMSTEQLSKHGLEKEYDGPMYQVLSDVFSGMSQKPVITASNSYVSAQGFHGIKTSIKAAESYLFPLDKGFLAIPKPCMYIKFIEIAAVTFSRVTTAASTKTFEIKISLTSGTEHIFSSIPKEEHERIENYCRMKKLPTHNEIADDVQYKVLDDIGSESEDDDFVARSGSDDDVNEEFNEDYSSNSDQSERGNASDADENSEPEAEEKPVAEAKQVKKRRKTSNENEPKKKQKKEKKIGPKRPMSSFLFFSGAMRSKVKEENPGFTIGEIGKELGARWKNMSAEDKKQFEEMAAVDKSRYARELETFQKTGVLPDGSKPASSSTVKTEKPKEEKEKMGATLSAEFIEEDDDDF